MKKLLLTLPLLIGASGCIGTLDSAALVKDLRILGIQLDPPEILAPDCSALSDPRQFSSLTPLIEQPVVFKALIADPKNPGRVLTYGLSACATTSDNLCSSTPAPLVINGAFQPTATAPDLSFSIHPGMAPDPNSTPPLILFDVLSADPNRGLGGVLEPLVFHLVGGPEEIYAQKRMVYDCDHFAGTADSMKPNQLPVLEGLTLNGNPWSDVVLLTGFQSYTLEPVDFSSRQEDYVVPGFQVQGSRVILPAVHLKESWLLSWQSDSGSISPGPTGGTSAFSGVSGPHQVKWTPDSGAPEQDVTFWVVARDGRGGESWITRKAHYKPQ